MTKCEKTLRIQKVLTDEAESRTDFMSFVLGQEDAEVRENVKCWEWKSSKSATIMEKNVDMICLI